MNIAVTSTVRPLTADDIPAVAGLFARIFLKSKTTPAALAPYLKSLYLDGPWRDAELNSLVHQRHDGELTGFVGVIPTPLKWGTRRLRGVVTTALMVEAHETDPMAGARLLRSVLAGPQDVTICETSSDTAMTMWRRLRGVTLPAYSFTFTRVLRPVGALAEQMRRRTVLAAPLVAIAPALDALALRLAPERTPRWWSYSSPPDARLVDEAIAPRDLPPLLPALLDDVAIAPDWSVASLDRILAESAEKPAYGPPVCRIVRTQGGSPVGAFLYHGTRGGTARVMQLLAKRANVGTVLDRLMQHAAATGMVAVTGRTEPYLMDALLGRKVIQSHSATSGVHSDDPAIVEAFVRGDARCTGIFGESWARLIGDDFRGN